jgi:hypothetical protein
MNAKQFIASAFFTSLLIVPKYLFLKPGSFSLDMLLNVSCFLVGCTIGALLFMKKPATANEKVVKKEEPLAPVPEATKAEDFGKYMPK